MKLKERFVMNVRRCLNEEYKANHPYVEHKPGTIGAMIRGHFE